MEVSWRKPSAPTTKAVAYQPAVRGIIHMGIMPKLQLADVLMEQGILHSAAKDISETLRTHPSGWTDFSHWLPSLCRSEQGDALMSGMSWNVRRVCSPVHRGLRRRWGASRIPGRRLWGAGGGWSTCAAMRKGTGRHSSREGIASRAPASSVEVSPGNAIGGQKAEANRMDLQGRMLVLAKQLLRGPHGVPFPFRHRSARAPTAASTP